MVAIVEVGLAPVDQDRAVLVDAQPIERLDGDRVDGAIGVDRESVLKELPELKDLDLARNLAAELELSMGKVAQPMRVALTGAGISPSIDKTLWLMGKRRSLEGIAKALAFIEARIAAQ